mmetsp:Transcript_41493/g.125705  ORF Transcript_41493/g.125705 Transcript_41493/m.125705 type:complete len:240 (+) Transcript_41493:76-795(+)
MLMPKPKKIQIPTSCSNGDVYNLSISTRTAGSRIIDLAVHTPIVTSHCGVPIRPGWWLRNVVRIVAHVVECRRHHGNGMLCRVRRSEEPRRRAQNVETVSPARQRQVIGARVNVGQGCVISLPEGECPPAQSKAVRKQGVIPFLEKINGPLAVPSLRIAQVIYAAETLHFLCERAAEGNGKAPANGADLTVRAIHPEQAAALPIHARTAIAAQLFLVIAECTLKRRVNGLIQISQLASF